MRSPEPDRRPRSGWSRRALALYWIFVAAVVAGTGVLAAAVRVEDRPIALALVAAGLAFAVAMGVVLLVRAGRER
jgi:hypothetical protein